ncbi:MAG: hypothetical protein ACKVVP_00055 [Chloroflexota bacterium]
MTYFRLALLIGVAALTLGIASINSVQAQPTPTDIAAYDGATLFTQHQETQTLFVATWGARAAEIWAIQHNADLVAAGFPIPQPVAQITPVDQSGAQTSSDDNDNEDSNDNDDEDSNDNDDLDSNDND